MLSYYLLVLIHCFLQTISCYASWNLHGRPYSSCGDIGKIRHPFRLIMRSDDDDNGTTSPYELLCQNNTAYLYLNSTKYRARAIHYNNYTIRLSYYPALTSHICSQNFTDGSNYPNYHTNTVPHILKNPPVNGCFPFTKSITYISCPSPLLNSSSYGLVETTSSELCNDGRLLNGRKVYVKYGGVSAPPENMCRVEVVAMTSLRFENGNNLSLSDIHACLEYGFEVSWLLQCENGLPSWFIINGNLPPKIILRAISVWIVYITVALKLMIGIPIFGGFVIYKLLIRRSSLMFDEEIESFLQSNNHLMPIRYSYYNIIKITRDFQEKLGQGGYGTVYKGQLRSGHDVAVKVLNKPKKARGPIDFINEVGTIGRIHHVNVVRLIGYCVEGLKCALIYDYMPNGSLDKHIFGDQSVGAALSCRKKYEIAIGVARGIEYLHLGCVLHFDIKPHNILLDADLTPKISDFGLAKYHSMRGSSITLTTPRGTIGYVAPELMSRSIGRVSNKVDVYSFGMLVLELVGLKRNVVGDKDKSSQYFPYWIYEKLNREEDLEMGRNGAREEEGAMKMVKRMTIVGLWCIQMCPEDRPSISEVVRMLEDESADLKIPYQPSDQSPFIGQEIGPNLTTEASDYSSIRLLGGNDEYKGEQD